MAILYTIYIYIFKKCSFDQIFCFGVRFFCWNRIIRFCVSSCECPLCSHYQTMRSVICVDCIVRKKLFSSFSIGIFIFAVELCQTWKLHMFQCWAFRPFFFLSFSLIAVKLFKPHRNRWVPFIFDFFTTFSIFFLQYFLFDYKCFISNIALVVSSLSRVCTLSLWLMNWNGLLQ